MQDEKVLTWVGFGLAPADTETFAQRYGTEPDSPMILWTIFAEYNRMNPEQRIIVRINRHPDGSPIIYGLSLSSYMTELCDTIILEGDLGSRIQQEWVFYARTAWSGFRTIFATWQLKNERGELSSEWAAGFYDAYTESGVKNLAWAAPIIGRNQSAKQDLGFLRLPNNDQFITNSPWEASGPVSRYTDFGTACVASLHRGKQHLANQLNQNMGVTQVQAVPGLPSADVTIRELIAHASYENIGQFHVPLSLQNHGNDIAIPSISHTTEWLAECYTKATNYTAELLDENKDKEAVIYRTYHIPHGERKDYFKKLWHQTEPLIAPTLIESSDVSTQP